MASDFDRPVRWQLLTANPWPHSELLSEGFELIEDEAAGDKLFVADLDAKEKMMADFFRNHKLVLHKPKVTRFDATADHEMIGWVFEQRIELIPPPGLDDLPTACHRLPEHSQGDDPDEDGLSATRVSGSIPDAGTESDG